MTKINRDYDVPYLAGSSKDGKTVYIDRRFPEKLKLKSGKEINPTKYLMIHETVEKKLIDQGLKYQEAHKKAIVQEKAAVEADGIEWDDYNSAYAKYIKIDEHCFHKIPEDLDETPEVDEKDKKTLNRMENIKNKQLQKSFLESLCAISEDNGSKKDSYRKDFVEGYLLKGAQGEGSRGGKIVGHTKSGKPVYASRKHDSYHEFTSEEHEDARNIHQFRGDHKKADSHKWDANLARQREANPKLQESHKHQVEVERTKQEVKNVKKEISKLSKSYFLNQLSKDLSKGGPGSGIKGHTTARQDYPQPPAGVSSKYAQHMATPSPIDPDDKRDSRTPIVGVNAHDHAPAEKKEESFVPSGGFEPHYSDTPPIKAYKNVISFMKKQGMDFQGHITLDQKTGSIKSISEQGEKVISYLKDLAAGNKNAQKPGEAKATYTKEARPEAKTLPQGAYDKNSPFKAG